MNPIRVGIGGWTFAPWRGTFYPPGLPHAQELAYASRHLTSIEINGTFYGSQKPESFRAWRDQTPDGFVFSIKGPRFATHKRDLTEAAPSIARFLESGVLELGPKLGPILWQFPPTRKFEVDTMRPFLGALPASINDHRLRHVIEARHPSFGDPAWIEELREHGVAGALVESDKHVLTGDVTSDFVYARLEHNAADSPMGYPADAFDAWAERLPHWASGKQVGDLPLIGPAPGHGQGRDCFVYFISGEKVAAPRAAQAMIARLAGS